jgi:hypothetical protein
MKKTPLGRGFFLARESRCHRPRRSSTTRRRPLPAPTANATRRPSRTSR